MNIKYSVPKPQRSTAKKGKRGYQKTTRRERQIITGRDREPTPTQIAEQNLRDLDKPRRKPPRSFAAGAEHVGVECATCFVAVEEGQRVHFKRTGELVHHRHDHTPAPAPTVCSRCFLVTPCECDS